MKYFTTITTLILLLLIISPIAESLELINDGSDIEKSGLPGESVTHIYYVRNDGLTSKDVKASIFNNTWPVIIVQNVLERSDIFIGKLREILP